MSSWFTPPLQDASDEALMGLLAGGRQDALGPLYTRYAPVVFSLAAKTLGAAGAEEIVQDVFLAVWRAAPSFDAQRGAVRPWLLQIAHFRIINELRRRSRRPRVQPDADGPAAVELPDREPDPAEAAWQEEERTAVRSAFEALPPTQRQAVGLAFFGGLTHAEVAEQLHLPLGTAKTRIRTGLQRLRLVLTPLLAALALVLGGLLLVIGAQYQAHQAARQRDGRALSLLTASDTADLRLAPTSGMPDEAHGRYRGRPGAAIAVFTLSHVPPAPAGQTYQVWVQHGGTWTSLGVLRPDTSGGARLIAEAPQFMELPEAVQVTLEPDGGSATPRGPVVLLWSGG